MNMDLDLDLDMNVQWMPIVVVAAVPSRRLLLALPVR